MHNVIYQNPNVIFMFENNEIFQLFKFSLCFSSIKNTVERGPNLEPIRSDLSSNPVCTIS